MYCYCVTNLLDQVSKEYLMLSLLVVCYLLLGFVAASVTVSIHKFKSQDEYTDIVYDSSLFYFAVIFMLWPLAVVGASVYYIFALLDVYINFLQRRL